MSSAMAPASPSGRICEKIFLVKLFMSESQSLLKRSLLEWNTMNGSISIENISFSRNCYMKRTTSKERH